MFKSMDAQQAAALATQLSETVESGQEVLSAVEAVYGRYPDGKVDSLGGETDSLTACWEYSLPDGTIWNDSIGVVSSRLGVTVTLGCSQVKDNRLAGEYARLSLSSGAGEARKGAWDIPASEEDI